MKSLKNALIAFLFIICINTVLIAQKSIKKTTECRGTTLIKEEVHHDTCYRIYNALDFNKCSKKWWTLAELLYNEVLDSTISYGVFYVLDDCSIDSKKDFFSIMNDKTFQNKTICKFYYNCPDPNFIIDPFKTGKYKNDKKGDNTPPGL